MKKKLVIASAALLAMVPLTSLSTEFNQLLTEKSAVSFVFKQMNVPIDGQFKRIKGQVSFDPAKPAAAVADIELDVSAIDAGSADANDEVVGKLWFNAKAFPSARVVSSSFKALGNNQFEATGKMTLKGKTMDVKAPVTFRPEGNNGVLEGSFIVKRADYGIGEGIWADFGTVANDVQIKFRLLLAPAAPASKATNKK